jgi:hypothetical protein
MSSGTLLSIQDILKLTGTTLGATSALYMQQQPRKWLNSAKNHGLA